MDLPYWHEYILTQNENFPQVVREARSAVETIVDEPLSFGQRMILRRIARDCMDEQLPIVGTDAKGFTAFYVVHKEATIRFIHEFYPDKPIEYFDN